MAKNWISFAALLALAGCGGSGDKPNRAPTTTGATATLNEDAAATQIAITASDPDNDTLTLSVSTQPTKGAVAVLDRTHFTYTPTANQNGADQFTYSVRDPDGLTATATVNITITPQPDAPVVQGGTIGINEDVAGTFTATATNIDGDAVTASIVAQPTRGAVAITGTNPFTFTYTPAQDQNGTDSFTFRVVNAGNASANGTVAVTIAAVPDLPRIAPLSVVTPEDTGKNGLVNATDPDGGPDPLVVAVATPPVHGTVVVGANGQYAYTPAQDYFGADSFSVVAHSGTRESAEVQIPITVTSVNDLPVALDDTASIAATGASDIDVTANDEDIEDSTLTVEIVTQPPGANAVVNNGAIRVTPAAGALGPTRLSYLVRDSDGGTATASVRIVMGDAAPLYFTTSAPTPPGKRIYRYDFLGEAQLLDTPLPAGATLDRFTISRNGARMVYVSQSAGTPVRHRLWLKNLDDLSAPVTEITTDTGFFTYFLALSPDGSLVAFNDKCAETATPAVSSFIDPGNSIEKRLFTANSDKLYYTMLIAGGGRVIKRADVDANGALVNRAQMTASYGVAEGLGSNFVLTPDETKIVSTGLFILGPPISGPKQHAYVTTADGSQDDTRLHPAFVTAIDGTDLPQVTADSRYGFYHYTVNSMDNLAWADLQAPGTNTVATPLINPFSAMRLAGNSRHGFIKDAASIPFPWSFFRIDPSQALGAFLPLGNGIPAPREVEAAPDGSAMVFDSGAGIYATLGNQFSTATLLFTRPGSSLLTLKYAPDSASVGVSNAGETGLFVVNPKAPGWSDTLSENAATPGALCMAYPGDSC